MKRKEHLLEKAMRFAVGEHREQTDRAGMPYIAHICAVVAAVDGEVEKVVAALDE